MRRLLLLRRAHTVHKNSNQSTRQSYSREWCKDVQIQTLMRPQFARRCSICKFLRSRSCAPDPATASRRTQRPTPSESGPPRARCSPTGSSENSCRQDTRRAPSARCSAPRTPPPVPVPAPCPCHPVHVPPPPAPCAPAPAPCARLELVLPALQRIVYEQPLRPILMPSTLLTPRSKQNEYVLLYRAFHARLSMAFTGEGFDRSARSKQTAKKVSLTPNSTGSIRRTAFDESYYSKGHDLLAVAVCDEDGTRRRRGPWDCSPRTRKFSAKVNDLKHDAAPISCRWTSMSMRSTCSSRGY